MDEQENIIFTSRPALRNPYVICGFTGWVNGGDVSVGGTNYLIKQFKAEKFAEMPTSRYHVYQIPGADGLRPVFKMQDGLIVDTYLPKNEFYAARNPESDHDLIIFKGTEPALKWEEYTDAIVNLATGYHAARLFTFCGLIDRSPYTREPHISCTCTGAAIKAEMEKYGVLFSNREGSATFNQMLIYACQQKGLEGVNFTARVPFYPEFNVAIGYCAKSVKAVMSRLNHLMRYNLNFDELDSEIKEMEGKLDFVRQQNPQFNTYIEELEKEYVEMPERETLDISASEAINLAEEFLKGNSDQPKDQ